MGIFLPVAVALVLGAAALFLSSSMRLRDRTPRDVRTAVRVHGLVAALVALLLSPGIGLEQILGHTAPVSGVPQEHAGGWMTAEVRLDVAWPVWLPPLAGPIAVAAVHAVAQRTFPAPRGPLRRASLTPRHPRRLLPVRLIALGALPLACIAAVSLLLAGEPAVP